MLFLRFETHGFCMDILIYGFPLNFIETLFFGSYDALIRDEHKS